MPIISVEYELLAGIQVNTDTGEVQRVVIWPEEFNCVEPHQFYTGYEDSDHELDEYLDKDHELAKKAVAIADRVIVSGDCVPNWTVRPE
jgi:hypothetical protein